MCCSAGDGYMCVCDGNEARKFPNVKASDRPGKSVFRSLSIHKFSFPQLLGTIATPKSLFVFVLQAVVVECVGCV